ncbi:triacylglycerol lipase [Xanthomonas citri pv. citri]|nr:triacylglycerol lipase [Xanthomonas citri pv. citri]
MPTQGRSASSNSYPEHGNTTNDPNVTYMVDNELNPTHAHTIQCTPLPFSE